MKIWKAAALVSGASIIGWGFSFTYRHFTEQADEGMIFDRPQVEMPVVSGERPVLAEPALPVPVEPLPPVTPKIWPDVPFISQAPTGEWGKSEFQNGCEEASALMVHAWREGKAYTKETARAELVAMARYQEEKIGQGIDTDVADTARLLLVGYFDIAEYRLAYDFTLDDLRQATGAGLVIVPANGRALGNPNFTAPGPLEHMLVVTGYDAEKKEFITNDPGTRKGAGYRYPEQVLFDAIREYPTGKHVPITINRKAMIIVPVVSNS